MAEMSTVKIVDGVCDDCESESVTCYESTLEMDAQGTVWKRCGECGQIY